MDRTRFKNFDIYWFQREQKLPGRKLQTKPPIIYLEGYDHLEFDERMKDDSDKMDNVAFTLITFIVAVLYVC